MSEPEFSRPMHRGDLASEKRSGSIAATSGECAALARRFDLPTIASLEADYRLAEAGAAIRATGQMRAQIEQLCSVSGEPFAVAIDEGFDVRFSASLDIQASGEDEIELSDEDCDIMPLDGDRFDLGEAVAQTLYLALDPYPEGPDAQAVRDRYDLSEKAGDGPFAALAKLQEKPERED